MHFQFFAFLDSLAKNVFAECVWLLHNATKFHDARGYNMKFQFSISYRIFISSPFSNIERENIA